MKTPNQKRLHSTGSRRESIAFQSGLATPPRVDGNVRGSSWRCPTEHVILNLLNMSIYPLDELGAGFSAGSSGLQIYSY
jgi:hypothetical protein